MVHFVGAGPGAVDLITVRGRNLLEAADVVIYAGSLVNPALLEKTKPGCRVLDSARMTLPEILREMERAEKAGLTTVRLHSGDPCIYGAVREQMEELGRRRIPYDVTPGVTAFCAAAASLKTELMIPGLSQSVTITRASGRTAVPARESIRSFAAHRAVLALYLSSAKEEDVKRELLAGGYPETTPVSVVFKASWPEEVILRSDVAHFPAAMREKEIDRSAVILVGEALGREGGASDDGGGACQKPAARTAFPVSRLYSSSFSTGCREAEERRFVLFGCSPRALVLMRRASEFLKRRYPGAHVRTIVKVRGEAGYEPGGIADLTGEVFPDADLLVYFGAAGIAVRSIAPFVRSKAEDPAVLSVDEAGKYCISLLSGHIGGANRYAAELSEFLGAVPVITTATDLEGRFAVDVFASENGLRIREPGRIRAVSSAVLRGEQIPVYLDPFLKADALPEELKRTERREEARVVISCLRGESDRPDALHLVPRVVCLGIGCRRGTPEEEIRAAADRAVRERGIDRDAVAELASVTLKEQEPGLLKFASETGLPIRFFPPEELNRLSGTFSASDFVRETAGTDCVCERAAVLAAGRAGADALILKKMVCGRVTAAAAVRAAVLRGRQNP